MLFRYETHLHTTETSSCGKIKACDLVRLYKEAGYQGVVVTDHYYDGFFKKLENLRWKDKVDTYLEGYRKAYDEGEKVGLSVILGMELRFEGSPNDYLVYGVTEDFLKENSELYTMSIRNFKELAEENGLIIYQAHPFRTGNVVSKAEFVDGIEVFNGHPGHESNNILAYHFAKERGLKMLSGSDCHELSHVARGGIETDKILKSSKDLAEYLKMNDDIRILVTVKT